MVCPLLREGGRFSIIRKGSRCDSLSSRLRQGLRQRHCGRCEATLLFCLFYIFSVKVTEHTQRLEWSVHSKAVCMCLVCDGTALHFLSFCSDIT